MDRPRPFTKQYKLAILKRRCLILVVFFFTLFALNYIFSPYKYIDTSTNGSKFIIEYTLVDGGLMRLTTTKRPNGDISYYVKDEKVDMDKITYNENFYAIVEAEPLEKIYFTKKKDLLYFFKKIKGPLFSDKPRV